jgi:hypothetical protein
MLSRVKIEITAPGGYIHANSAHSRKLEHSDVYVAPRDAFDNEEAIAEL